LWIRVIGMLSYLLMSLISTLGQFLSFKVFLLCSCFFVVGFWGFDVYVGDCMNFVHKMIYVMLFKKKKRWYMLSTFVWFKIAQLVFAHWHWHVTDTNTAHWH
jgi:hypothetical protein